jgi:molybdate transport system substrate-binding protein
LLIAQVARRCPVNPGFCSNQDKEMSVKARYILAAAIGFMAALSVQAEQITIAAAADLKFAMDEVASAFRKQNPNQKVDVIYGSSGKFFTQIQQGAPYDLFFSADISFPHELKKAGFTASDVMPYAIGRIVLWSNSLDATKLTFSSLADSRITRIAIANPKHAPYGMRAEEAMISARLWNQLSAKLVYGENIAQTAQYVQTGNAQVGVIALSLAKSPELSRQGGYYLIPASLHRPLEQGFVITKRAEANSLAKRFSAFASSKPAQEILSKFGFSLTDEKAD